MGRRLTFAFLAMTLVVGLSCPQPGTAAPSAEKINIAVKQEVFSLDATYDSFGYNGIVIQNMYEFIIHKDPSGNLGPGLATSWTVSPDGKTIDFTLRKGVKFHSGDLFTAKDVVFTFNRGRKVNPRLKSHLRYLDKVEAVDDYHVRFLFKRPDVTFLSNRAVIMIVSKSYYDRVGEDKFVKTPSGTGPYKFVHYQPAAYIDFDRYEGYWGKKPSVRAARIYFVKEDTTRVAKLQTGEVDLIQGTPFNLVKTLEKDPNLKVVKAETNSPNRSITFSTRNPKNPWSDKRVRQAMAYAIDADMIVRTVLMGIPNRYPYMAPGDLGYDPTIKNYPYDPEKAKQLLAEAGYPKGFKCNLYWRLGGRVPMSAQIVEAIVSNLGAVGIMVKPVGMEAETFNTKRRAAKKPDTDYLAYDAGSLAGYPDPTYGARSRFLCDGSSSSYCNPEFDKIAKEGLSTMDEAKRAALIKQMVKILREDVASIIIFNNVAVFGMNKNIDFVPTQDRFDVVHIKDMAVK